MGFTPNNQSAQTIANGEYIATVFFNLTMAFQLLIVADWKPMTFGFIWIHKLVA